MSSATFYKQLHRILTIGLLSLFFASSHGLARHLQHQDPQSKSHPICIRQRISVNVDYEGCESTNTTIPICTGQCRSYTYVDLLPPFQFRKCNCCQATDFTSKPKVRRLNFRCNGDLVEKKVYFTYVRKCGCVSCTGWVNPITVIIISITWFLSHCHTFLVFEYCWSEQYLSHSVHAYWLLQSCQFIWTKLIGSPILFFIQLSHFENYIYSRFQLIITMDSFYNSLSVYMCNICSVCSLWLYYIMIIVKNLIMWAIKSSWKTDSSQELVTPVAGTCHQKVCSLLYHPWEWNTVINPAFYPSYRERWRESCDN